MASTKISVKRADIVWVNLEPVKGSETGKTRMCVVIQNNIGNQYSPSTIIAVITEYNEKKAKIAICVPVDQGEGGLTKQSIVDCGQIRTVDRLRITGNLGTLKPETMEKIDKALKISLSLK